MAVEHLPSNSSLFKFRETTSHIYCTCTILSLPPMKKKIKGVARPAWHLGNLGVVLHPKRSSAPICVQHGIAFCRFCTGYLCDFAVKMTVFGVFIEPSRILTLSIITRWGVVTWPFIHAIYRSIWQRMRAEIACTTICYIELVSNEDAHNMV